MLSVIVLIIKIIGIAILVLFCILLFLLLIILLVPIRYSVKVEHGDSLTLDGGVSWLLHFVHGRISWHGKNRRIWIRIIGILIYDSLRPPRIKKVRSRRKKGKYNKTQEKQALSEEITSKEVITSQGESNSKEVIASQEESNSKEVIISKAKDKPTDERLHSRDSLFAKVYKKIKTKVINFFQRIVKKIKELIRRFWDIRDKVSLIQDFIHDDTNRTGFRFTYNTLKKLLKHILPRKLRSRLIFGTGDPCSTGQALGILGILYSLYGDNLKVTPDFEKKVFEGSHYARGRIRIWTLLIIVIKLLLDKRFKDLKMNYQLLKEAL